VQPHLPRCYRFDRAREIVVNRNLQDRGSTTARTDWKRVWLISAASWLVIAIVQAGTTYSYWLGRNDPMPFWGMFKDVGAHNVLGAILTPGVYKLALSFPFSSKRIASPLTVHIAASVAFALLNAAWHFALFPLHLSPDSHQKFTWPWFFGFSSYAWFIDTSTTYIPVLAIAYMVNFYQKYREGELEKVVLDAQLAKAQLSFLRSQLNPHFLFNALHSIGSLMHFDVDAADRMMSKLSDLLRMALDQTNKDEIELEDELVFLDRYLEIEAVRLGTRLRVVRDIPQETLHVKIPSLILQPLVENAVIHGIAELPEGGEVLIQTRLSQRRLNVLVRNDGALRSSSFRQPWREGVGLRIIRERLSHMFGPNHSFQLKSKGGHVTVEVSIPCESVVEPPVAVIQQTDVFPSRLE
jgi:two-component system, LytTR family, sensor kinase